MGKQGEMQVMDGNQIFDVENMVVYICQILILYIWKLHNVINQCYLNKKEIYILLQLIKLKVEEITDLDGPLTALIKRNG